MSKTNFLMHIAKSSVLAVLLCVFGIFGSSCNDTINYDSGEDENLSIYPNPASDRIAIYFRLWYDSDMSMYINDIFGRKVAEGAEDLLLKAGDHVYDLDVTTLPVGIYSIILEINGQKFIKDFMVMR